MKASKKKNADSLRNVKDLEKRIKTLETTNNNHLSKIKTETSECDKLKAQRDVLSFEKERLAKAKNETLQRIEGLETEKNRLELKIKAKECEIKQLREERDNIAKANGDSLQRIEGLETEKNRLESEIKNTTCEMEKLCEERDSIATANTDSLQKIKDLKKKIKEINKYKSALSRKYNLF